MTSNRPASQLTGRSPGGASPGQVFDRPQSYPEKVVEYFDNYNRAAVSYHIVSRDARLHYRDATLDDAIHTFNDMVAWANVFLGLIQMEAGKKGEAELFNGALRQLKIDVRSKTGFDGMDDYADRLATAVAGAVGFARKYQLFIAERQKMEIPFDQPVP